VREDLLLVAEGLVGVVLEDWEKAQQVYQMSDDGLESGHHLWGLKAGVVAKAVLNRQAGAVETMAVDHRVVDLGSPLMVACKVPFMFTFN